MYDASTVIDTQTLFLYTALCHLQMTHMQSMYRTTDEVERLLSTLEWYASIADDVRPDACVRACVRTVSQSRYINR